MVWAGYQSSIAAQEVNFQCADGSQSDEDALPADSEVPLELGLQKWEDFLVGEMD